MSRFGWDDWSFQIDKADSGTLQEMKTYILSFNGLSIEAILEEVTVAGSSWEMSDFVGLKRGEDLTIGLLYDDTATTGPDVVFGIAGAATALVSRSVVITWGGTKTSSFEAFLKTYRRTPAKGVITKCEAVITPTSTITEA